MAVLTDRDISRVINKKDIVIHPFESECLTGLGYDFRIGIIKPLTYIDQFKEDEDYITMHMAMEKKEKMRYYHGAITQSKKKKKILDGKTELIGTCLNSNSRAANRQSKTRRILSP